MTNLLNILSFYFTLCLLNNELVCFKAMSICDGDKKFKCDSKDCISLDNLCNGFKDCPDGSDETSEICSGYRCQAYLFRCKYGACIKASFKCDGIQHCADNSDETDCSTIIRRNNRRNSTTLKPTFSTPCTTTFPFSNIPTFTSTTDSTTPKTSNFPTTWDTTKKYTTATLTTTQSTVHKTYQSNIIFPNQNDQCVLPKFPMNGTWEIFGSHNKKKTGEFVSKNTTLVLKCKPGFHVYPSSRLATCGDFGIWDATFKCLRTCSPIDISTILIARCSFDGKEASCENALEGTIATLSNAMFTYNIVSQSICYNGDWISPDLYFKTNIL